LASQRSAQRIRRELALRGKLSELMDSDNLWVALSATLHLLDRLEGPPKQRVVNVNVTPTRPSWRG
jgi:hypothetical protein